MNKLLIAGIMVASLNLLAQGAMAQAEVKSRTSVAADVTGEQTSATHTIANNTSP